MGTPRDTVYPWGKGAHKQKSEHYRPDNAISKAQCAPHFALQKLRRSDYLSLRRKRFLVFHFLIQFVFYRVHNHIKSNLVISAFRHDDIGALLFRLDKPFVHRFDGRKVLQND